MLGKELCEVDEFLASASFISIVYGGLCVINTNTQIHICVSSHHDFAQIFHKIHFNAHSKRQHINFSEKRIKNRFGQIENTIYIDSRLLQIEFKWNWCADFQ